MSSLPSRLNWNRTLFSYFLGYPCTCWLPLCKLLTNPQWVLNRSNQSLRTTHPELKEMMYTKCIVNILCIISIRHWRLVYHCSKYKEEFAWQKNVAFVTILYSWSANGFSNQGENRNKTESCKILLQNNMQKNVFTSGQWKRFILINWKYYKQTFNWSF